MARVLIAGFCAVPGHDRVGVQLGHVVRALTRHHSVDVLCIRRGDQAYVERRGSARILRVPVADDSPVAQVETFRRAMRRQLEGADYDVVVVGDGWSGIPALEARESLRYALVFDATRAPLVADGGADPALVAMGTRDEDECMRAADLVLAATEPAGQFLASRCRPENVHIAPVGVDVDLFDWEDAPKVGPDRILCVGSFGPASLRDLSVLIEAMELVAHSTDAHMTLAGPVSAAVRSALSERIDDLGLSSRVELLGEVEHRRVPELIAQATVCVVPSAADLSPRPTTVYPTKILEYLACRRAVVAPRQGTVTLILRDRQHGLLFQPGDARSLATQIVRLLIDPELRERLAAAGYEMARRDHAASGARRAINRAFTWLSTRGPWVERWHRTDELSEAGPAPAPAGGGVTESLALVAEQPLASRPRAQRSPFGSDSALFDSDDAGDPEDLTMVEGGRRLAFDTAEARLERAGTTDAWVVEDMATGAVSADDTRARDDDRHHPAGARSRFVAGEIGGRQETEAGELDPMFTAIAPLLGGTDEPEPPARGPGRQRPPSDDD